MQFVDENHRVGVVHKLFHDGFQALFKLPAILGSRDDQGEIQHQNPFVGKKRRNLSVHDPLRKTFDDGCLSDARIADQNRIIFRAAAEDLNHAVNLRVTAYERVQNAVHRRLRQVSRKLAEKRRFLRLDERLAIHH